MKPKNSRHSALFTLFCLALSAPLLFTQAEAGKDENLHTAKKLQTIKLPKVELKEVSFLEALEIIRKQSRLYDSEENPEKKGVNFLVKGRAKPEADRPITLILTNVSLGDVLRRLCSLSGHSMKIQNNGIIFTGSAGAGR